MHRGVPRLTECQFFQGTAEGFGEHEVDKRNLKRKPAAVRDEIPPTNVFQPNGVDKGGEEAGHSAEELEDSNTAGSFLVRPYLNHVR